MNLTLSRGLIVCAAVTLVVGIANAQIPSARQRMGYNGPVRSVRFEVQDFSWDDPRWEVRGEPVHAVVRYDRDGRCLTVHIDPGSGWRPYGLPLPPLTAAPSQRYEILRKPDGKWKTVWLFDKQGRLERFEAYGVYESGPSLANWQQYSYDSQGRVEELTYWADWGRHPNQTEPYPPKRLKYWFDSAGRIGGWTNVNEPGSRATLSYDEKGRIVQQVEEDVDSHITYVSTQTWDGYDRHDNWTLHTYTWTWRTTDEGDEPQSRTVIRRSLKYDRGVPLNQRSSGNNSRLLCPTHQGSSSAIPSSNLANVACHIQTCGAQPFRFWFYLSSLAKP